MSTVFKAGHTAVITGGASGIGLALAKKCHGYGMRVLVADWDDETLKAVESNVGGPVATFKMDVGKAEDWAGLKDKVDEELGGGLSRFSLLMGCPCGQIANLLLQEKSTSSPSTQAWAASPAGTT